MKHEQENYDKGDTMGIHFFK